MAILTEHDRSAFLTAHPDWTIEHETLDRVFAFADFVAAMGFVTSVAILSEKAFHHPDIDIRWNRVTIRLTTHDEGGLTVKDTNLATSIDALTSGE